jgi:streptomycin 6-kinase
MWLVGESSRRGEPALSLPANLVDSVSGDATSERREWLAELPRIVLDLARRWALHLGEPFQPGGRSAWVAPATDPAGRELVLKVGGWHDEAAHEADGLRAWQGRGAVLLHDAHVGEQTSALLLARCRPGAALAEAVPEPGQDVVVAGLLQKLWITPPAGHPFRPLQEMCQAWAAEFTDRLAATPGACDPGLARAAVDLLRTSPPSAGRDVLLVTDLHAGNVLSAQREPWLVVDPKPYVGDPAYDPVQHLLNCDQRLPADPLGLAHRMADLLDLDRDRVTWWLLARCVQESLDQPWLGDVAVTLAATR